MSDDPPPNLTVRPFRPRDFATISALNQATFADHVARETGFSDDGPVKRLNRLGSIKGRLINSLSRRPLSGLVVEEDGALIGYVVTMHANSDTTILFDVSVAPYARRRGFGRTLFLAAETEARRRGYSQIIATVWPNNVASIGLLEALGYIPAPTNPVDPATGIRSLVKPLYRETDT